MGEARVSGRSLALPAATRVHPQPHQLEPAMEPESDRLFRDRVLLE